VNSTEKEEELCPALSLAEKWEKKVGRKIARHTEGAVVSIKKVKDQKGAANTKV